MLLPPLPFRITASSSSLFMPWPRAYGSGSSVLLGDCSTSFATWSSTVDSVFCRATAMSGSELAGTSRRRNNHSEGRTYDGHIAHREDVLLGYFYDNHELCCSCLKTCMVLFVRTGMSARCSAVLTVEPVCVQRWYRGNGKGVCSSVLGRAWFRSVGSVLTPFFVL